MSFEAAARMAEFERARAIFQAGRFIRDRYRSAADALEDARSARDLHEARKLLKDARNALRLIGELGGKGSASERRMVKKIDESLGSWRDEHMLWREMRRFIADHEKAAASETLMRLKPLASELRKRNLGRFPDVVRESRRALAALRKS
jgi:CHAD domain-containing protein